MDDEKRTARRHDDVFYEAFKASPIGIAIEDLEGRPLFVNPALCSMLAFSEEEMLRKHCVEFSPREDADKDWSLFERLRAGAIDHYHLDKRFIRPDGSLIWGRLSISLLKNGGSPLVVGIVQDITETRKVQDTLDLVAKQTAVAVTRCSRDFRYLWVNQGYADMLQRPISEIVGHSIVEVIGDEGFQSLWHYFERLLIGEQVHYEEEVNYRGMGHKWISATYTPTLDANAVVDGWVGVVVDITERRRSEEAVRRSAGYLAEAEKLAHSGSWAWNVHTRELFWSEEMFRILGYDPEKTEPSLSLFLARVHPEDRSRAEHFVNEEASGRDIVSEYRVVLPGGSTRYIRAIGHPVKNKSGEVIEVVGTTVDVTERKLGEEALLSVSQKLIEAEERERSRLARELHDDISQKLALLAVSLEGLRGNPPVSASELGKRIAEASNGIAEVGKDVQVLSHRLHSPKLELLGLAATASSFCREFSDLHNVKIDFHSENVPKGLSPEISLTLFRVLQEALQNATKHSGSDHFRVWLKGGAREIELTVHDSGVGFQPGEAMKGRGLGLTSMMERLKLVDGELSIDSQFRVGTTLHARVPLSPTAKSAGAA